jgi:hypothetical protein
MSTELDCQETDHTNTASSLDAEGRRLAEVAVDHPVAMDLRSTILQALRCLDYGVELSCSACSDLNHFVQQHRNGNADGSLDDCVRGLNWLLLQLSARDAVRSPSVVRWVRYIWEHSTDVQMLELGNALDAGLRALATGEQLDGQCRDVLVRWLMEPGVQREQAYESIVQQILRQGPPAFFSPSARAAEKQASRDADAAALASGEKNVEQLRAENSAFAFPRDRIRLTRSFPRAKTMANTPLTALTPGIYYLHMKDGTTIQAEIGVWPAIGIWWMPIPKHSPRETPNDDWSEVASVACSGPLGGEILVSVDRIRVTPLTPSTMDAIHGPPDPTDGTDGDTGSIQAIARALMAVRSASERKPGAVGWHIDILWEQDDVRIVADLSRCDGWVHILSQSRNGPDDEWWWTNVDDSIALPRSAVDRLIEAVSGSAHHHK